jgi:glycosyltransferase involved in cell wall biosynthesis
MDCEDIAIGSFDQQIQPETSQPLVSVITVVKNGENLLEKTIQSVLSQTYPNIEYIIIDGASTDGTLDIIRQYNGKIHHWVSEPDSGISEAFNKGIHLSSGEWINFLNAGDVFWQKDTIEQVSQCFSQSLILTGFAQFGQKVIPKRILSNQESLNLKSMVSHQASFVHRSVFDQVGRFNSDYQLRMDYDFWLRAFRQYDFLMLDEIWVDYDPNGMSGKPNNIRLFYAEEKQANRLNQVRNSFWINLQASLKCQIKLVLSRFTS